jgi:signal transduction histidine kinase
MLADYIAWAIAALVLGGSVAATVAFYHYLFRPLAALASAMKRFSGGDRGARAEVSRGAELAIAAGTFNEMADIITGQHERMFSFLSGTTHEVKDPVHVMRTELQEFAHDKPFPNERLARQRLDAVSAELDRLDGMVDRYLDTSSIEWSRLDLQLGRQDFRRLVEEVSGLYEGFSRAHRLALSLPERPVCLFADTERLSQVIHSLLMNAMVLSPRGGVVEVCLSAEGKEAILRVTDHGIGISEKDLATLFEPFERVSSTFQNSPGVPVALSVARRIVQGHLGRIEAFSKVGNGSTFRVYLPLAGPIASEEAAVGHKVPRGGVTAGHDRRPPSPSQGSARA